MSAPLDFGLGQRTSRRVALLVVAVLLLVWGSLSWVLYRKWDQALSAQRAQNSNLAHTLAEQTLRILVSVDQATLRARAGLLAGHFTAADLGRLARETGLESSILTQLSWVGPDGRFIGSDIDPSGRKTGPVDLSSRQHIRVHLQPPEAGGTDGDALFVGPAVVGKASGKLTIQLSRKVQAADGRLLGVIVASLSTDYFANSYRIIRLGEFGGVGLVGDDGHVRTRVLGGQVLGIEAGSSVYGQTLARHFGARPAGTSVVSVEGRLQITAVDRVGRYPLFLAVATDSEEALAEWQETRDLSLVVTLLFSLALGAAAMAVEQNLRRLQGEQAVLESEVQARTQRLQRALDELQAAQAQLVQSEKMASLGQLVASVAHEINTPIGAVRASGRNIADALRRVLADYPPLLLALDDASRQALAALIASACRPAELLSSKEERALTRRLAQRLEAEAVPDARHRAEILVQLRTTEHHLPALALLHHADAERILGTARDVATIINSTDNINLAVERVAKIVFALKTYSHSGGSSEFQVFDPVQGLDTVLTLYQNLFKHGIELVREGDPLPPIECLPDELNQVWTNLIHNALQAMGTRGVLTLATELRGEQVVVHLRDTGGGIPPEVLPRIFEPFFTTKPAGEGSGLGLDIVRKIVDKHHGHITVASEPGRGTTFSVALPLRQPAAGA